MKIHDGMKFGWLGLIGVMLGYTALSALIMGANPFRGETLAPTEMLSKYPGWASHNFTSLSSHPERSDILDGYLPGWIATKEAIYHNDKGLHGLARTVINPSMLVLSTAKWTPSFLAFLAVDEHWLGLYFAGLIKLVIAATGGFLFLRLFMTSLPAFLGGGDIFP